MGKTLAEKIWSEHVVRAADGEPDLLYIDLHLIHEVTSPQAFDGLRLAGRTVRRPELTIATEDHNVPTLNIDKPMQILFQSCRWIHCVQIVQSLVCASIHWEIKSKGLCT